MTEKTESIVSIRLADFSNINWRSANLSGVNLCGANLSSTLFHEADLSGADLGKADLRHAKFGLFLEYPDDPPCWTDLRGTDLSGVNLSGVDLSEVRNLEFAQLDQTLLRGVKGLTPEQLADCKTRGAIVDEEATPSPNAVATSSQETRPQTSPPPEARTSTNVQKAMPETATPQEHITIEKATPPAAPSSDDHAAPLLSSQEKTPSAPQQGTVTHSSPAQDAGT